jgi:rifampicin phosphotransferase
VPAGWLPVLWQRDEVYHPDPVMPMWRSVFLGPLTRGFKYFYCEIGSPDAGREYRDAGGWVYVGNIQSNAMSPQTLDFYLNHGEVKIGKRWYEEWQYPQKRRIAELKKVNPHTLADDRLVEHIYSVLMPFLEQSLKYQVLSEMAFAVSMARLAGFGLDILHWSDPQIMALLSGLSVETSDKLESADPEFAGAFAEYLHDHGCRGFHHAIHYPTLSEKPEIALRIVRDHLTGGFDDQAVSTELAEKRAVALAEARAALENRSIEIKEQFEKHMESARLIYPIKEGCEYDTFDVPMALMRYALLEMGDRMTGQGQLENRSDVFFLEMEEAVDGFRQGKNFRELVKQRKTEQELAGANPGPAFYGEVKQLPLELIPPILRSFVKGTRWVMEHYYGTEKVCESRAAQKLQGYAASAGRYSGPVCVIKNESEFGKLKAGDVLVCPITNPSWAILFSRIGALVTDTGGVLSHPAIIAREYRVPAVVATGKATRLLKDGQIVTVDGNLGTVEMDYTKI